MQDDANVISYHDDGGHNINMDIDCNVNFSLKTTLDEAIEEEGTIIFCHDNKVKSIQSARLKRDRN